MAELLLDDIATSANFNEQAYLAGNPDVAAAVARGQFHSGKEHYDLWGHNETRHLRYSETDAFKRAKKRKLERITPLLRKNMPHTWQESFVDFLTPQLQQRFNIVDSGNVSSNVYDGDAEALIRKHIEGLILDCGAGRRRVYLDNVVNFEIVAYDSTDVRGVGEVLPFKDDSFDAIFSLAVLEHVKDPFACAREITRVLKPGGDLMCCVPLLQPVHAYPHHYYNMTGEGLKNLFADGIEIDRHVVSSSVLPIWTLTWIARAWLEGLTGFARDEFLNLKISELLASGDQYLNCSFVKELSDEKNFELASATVLFGHKAIKRKASGLRHFLHAAIKRS